MVEAKKTTQLGDKEDQNPKKLYSRFIFKALILAVLCAVVPFFLSQTPELANQTRLLELLHLIFVGIAVSYGLFSRRNYDGGGSSTNNHKADDNNTSHSYVPKILEVSSVFNVDRESESEPSDDSSGNHRKFQTWRNNYKIKIPENRLVDQEKPLLLPVRSLRVSDNSDQWEKVRSKRKLLKSLADDNSEVLPSPIPWRSRSSMEIESQPSIDLQPLIKVKSSPLPNFPSPPPPPPPPPPPLPAYYNSASKKGIIRRESVQKTKFVRSEFHPPPPPPPPPPVDYYKSPPTKLRVSSERRKSSEQKMKVDERSTKRNSTKKVWWSDPIVESNENVIIRQDTEKKRILGSKANEESEDEEHRRRDLDEIKVKKKIEEEEGGCESSNGSDVDKKADEFIAKFREQIRLQRIESIKRSANKITANSSS